MFIDLAQILVFDGIGVELEVVIIVEDVEVVFGDKLVEIVVLGEVVVELVVEVCCVDVVKSCDVVGVEIVEFIKGSLEDVVGKVVTTSGFKVVEFALQTH